MNRQQVCSAGALIVFSVGMIGFGATSILTLRGGDEAPAANAASFVVVGTMMLGNVVTTHYKIATQDDSPERLFAISKTASIVAFGGLLLCFIMSSLFAGYRNIVLFRSIGFGCFGALVEHASGFYLKFHKRNIENQVPVVLHDGQVQFLGA